MNAPPPFVQFLEAGVAKGGFEADDVLSALLPLLRQVAVAHETGLVAPLDGIADLTMNEAGQLAFTPARVQPPVKNARKIEALQSPASHAVEVVA